MADRLNDNPWTSPEHRQLDTHNVDQHSLQVTDSARPNYHLITGKCSAALTSFNDTFSVVSAAAPILLVNGTSTSLTGQTVSIFCGKTLTVTTTAAAIVTIHREITGAGLASGPALYTFDMAANTTVSVPFGFGDSLKAGNILYGGVDYELSVDTTAGSATVTLSGVSTF